MKKWLPYLPFILLILLPLLAFWQTLEHEFVWDDDVHIVNNEYDYPNTSEGILKYWAPKPKLIYAPLTYTIWGLLKEGTISPVPFHLLNILVHTVTGILIFLIINTLIPYRWPAAAGALLFALHPLQVEAVAWATGLRTLLCGLFVFSSLLLYLQFRRKNNHIILCMGSIFAYSLALAAKPSAMILPAFLLILDYLYFRKSLKICISYLVPYLLVTLPFLWILLQTNTLPEYVPPLWSRPLIMTDAITFYLYKLLLPLKLCSFYGRTPAFVMQNNWFYLSWIFPAALAWVIAKMSKQHPPLLLGALIFLAGILPVSGLLPFEGQNWNTVADRYIYFSMFGVSLCFAYIINRWPAKKIIWFIAVSLLLFCFLRSLLVQVPQWQSDWKIWNNAITYFPDQSVPYTKRGELYMEQGNLELALYDFQRAVQRNPNFAKVYNNIGLIYSQQEKWDEALEAYLQAIRINPGLTKTHKNIGLIYLIRQEYQKAEQAFRKAINGDPNYADAYYQLGRIYQAQKKYQEAEVVFTEAVRLQPDHLKAQISLALLYSETGSQEKAADVWQTVLLYDPGNQQALEFFKKYHP